MLFHTFQGKKIGPFSDINLIKNLSENDVDINSYDYTYEKLLSPHGADYEG